MPVLNLSDLNTLTSVGGTFMLLYGIISIKIKRNWYLGEALPAMVIGIILGQVGAGWIEPRSWTGISGETSQTLQYDIALGVSRVVICIQLVMAGYQLPARYLKQRWKEMAILMFFTMTLMWLFTTACVVATVPKLTLLASMVVAACVTSTDPVLSQAVAKGPFADKYVRRDLREIISSEAGANDGFAFPFLMLPTFLIRHASTWEHEAEGEWDGTPRLMARAAEEVGRLGGGAGEAMKHWFLETILYFVLLSIAYGAVVGFMSNYGLKFALRRHWIDNESYLLWPTAMGLFLVGTCGLLGTDDLLACYIAGCALNWNGEFLAECEARHDEVNGSVDVLLNFGGFMYIGAIIPWTEFNDPYGTGLTWGRLIGFGVLVLVLRRLPALFASYKMMPVVTQNWKEALFMGYFGPIGIGACFYVEHARHLFPARGEAVTIEENDLTAAMGPAVYFLIFFSIVVHGLSVPLLNAFLKFRGVQPITAKEGPVELDVLARTVSLPKNSQLTAFDPMLRRGSIAVNNRFSRPADTQSILDDIERNSRETSRSRALSLTTRRSRAFSSATRASADDNIRFDDLDSFGTLRKYATEPRRMQPGTSPVRRPIPKKREIVFEDERTDDGDDD